MRPSASYFFELSLSLRCLCFVFLIPSILADHCVILTSLFLPPHLFSSPPSSLSFGFCSRDWHLKFIWLLFKESHSHAPHLIRSRQMHNGMVTLWRNDNNNALISAPEPQKLWRNQPNASPVWVSVARGWWWLTKSLSSSLHLLIPYCVTYCICDLSLCVCVDYTVCKRVKLKERL